MLEGELSPRSLERLGKLYDGVVPIPAVTGTTASGGASSNLRIIGRPDLHATLAKLNVWGINGFVAAAAAAAAKGCDEGQAPTAAIRTTTNIKRLLYLDADTLVLRSLDHLFDLLSDGDIEFAASPELGFPDCFNSGVMLLAPRQETLAEMLALAAVEESFDGGDQGLLNAYWGDGTRGHPVQRRVLANTNSSGGEGCDGSGGGGGSVSGTGKGKAGWHRIPFVYNMEMHKVYRLYMPAVLRYRDDHAVLHFIGRDKPWHFAEGIVERPEDAPAYLDFYVEMLGRWWDVRRQLPKELSDEH